MTPALHPGDIYLKTLAPWKGKGGFSLAPIRKVLSYLGNPQDKVPSIHVGGTNGKGSVCAMLAAILQQQGSRVGLSISPHLERVNERISINGSPISDLELFDTAMTLKAASESVREILSYHEALTALAFVFFSQRALDWMVIEVGLGGRLDASNVLANPKIVAITSIGRDHEAILGSEITSIAAEKAEIIKPGSQVVVGELPLQALKIIEKYSDVEAFGRDFRADYTKDRKIVFRNNSGHEELEIGKVALSGAYQLSNIAVTVKAARLLNISQMDIIAGLSNVKWPGRLERLRYKQSSVVLDGAHNIDAVGALLLDHKYNNFNKLNLIFGVLGTKRWQQMIEQFIPFVANWYLVEPESEMAVPSEHLAAHLSCFDITTRCFGRNVHSALEAVSDEKRDFMVCGSLYLVGQARAIIMRAS